MTPYIDCPEFCPRPGCRFYDPERAAAERWYCQFGSFFTKARGLIKRFRCKSCGKTCSTQTFSLHYWTHSTEDYETLMKGVCSCSGLRQHARFTDVSFRVVQNRIRHLARNCLAVIARAAEGYALSADLVMDGFESYTRSQYFPNNITMLVGSRSQYIYGAVHTLLRRKGRMSETQKTRRAMIDAHWRPPHKGIRRDCAHLLEDHAPMIDAACRTSPCSLYSDEHQEYRRALQMVSTLNRALKEGRLRHCRVSSRRARTVNNPLFAVNYVDRQIRKNMGEHVRETVKQGREVNCQMERMAIFMAMHNFLSPHRITDGVGRYLGPKHADEAGIDTSSQKLHLARLYTHRHLWGHIRDKTQWQKRVWLHEYENPPAVDYRSGEVSETCVALPPGRLYRHFLA